MTRTALITGISGQDGSYLAELLLGKGYEVHGVVRRSSMITTDRIDHLYQDPHERDVHLHLHYGDLTDGSQLARLIRTVRPDEIYNLAAQSHVAVSFQQPEYTGDVDGLGVLRLLEAIRDSGVDTRLYQAGTSEMFGDASPPQSEDTGFRPRSPYAAAKLYAYWLVRNYREAYGRARHGDDLAVLWASVADPLAVQISKKERRVLREAADNAHWDVLDADAAEAGHAAADLILNP